MVLEKKRKEKKQKHTVDLVLYIFLITIYINIIGKKDMSKLDYNRRANRVINWNKIKPNHTKHLTLETKLTFGKYIGMKVCDVKRINAKYILWLKNNSLHLTFDENV